MRPVPGVPGIAQESVDGGTTLATDRDSEAVGLACESAAVRRVARQFGLGSSTVRAIDVRYLSRWSKGRRKPALRQMGVDEIYLGKKQKFLTVVSNLETGEPLWLGRERKKQTLDEFFEEQLSAFQRSAITSGVCWRKIAISLHRPFGGSAGDLGNLPSSPHRQTEILTAPFRQTAHRRCPCSFWPSLMQQTPLGWHRPSLSPIQESFWAEVVRSPKRRKRSTFNDPGCN
jgi:hypothetical protein